MTPEEQEYIKNVAVVAAGIGVIVGAFVSSLAILINGWRQRAYDDRKHRCEIEAANLRHFRELALEAAITEWKQDIEDNKAWVPNSMRCESEVDRPMTDPFDYYLVKKLKMIQTFGDIKLSASEIPMKWEEMREFYSVINDPRKRIIAREQKE